MNKVAKIFSAATVGLDSYLVEVEVDIGAGLPDKAIEESKERVWQKKLYMREDIY